MSDFGITITGAKELVVKFERAAGALADGRGVVGTNLKYAKAVHDGSPPHVIRAKNKKALFWPGAAHPVRAVRHPGNKANPYLANALRAEAGAITADIGAGLADVVEGRAASIRPALEKATLRVLRTGMANAPVRPGGGTLRRSLRHEVQSR